MAIRKISRFALAIVIVLLAGCLYHKVSARQMIADMNEIKSGKNAIISILWYQGSDADFDYFAYVYSMTGTKNFKVPVGDLSLPRTKFTDDESHWVAIRTIDEAWSASRLRMSKGVWEKDSEGISIQLAR